MAIFNDKLSPSDLPPAGFVEFSLHVMTGYYVDLTQNLGWTQIATEDGQGVPLYVIGRKISPRITELGATLDRRLLNKIIRFFKIHGPELPTELTWKYRNENEKGGEDGKANVA